MISKETQLPQLSLRKADSGDIDRLEELVQLAYRGGKAAVAWKNEDHMVSGPRITKPELTAMIACQTAHILVFAAENETILGCVLVEEHEDGQAHVGMLAVSPDCQNMGLGKKLIKAAEDYAKNQLLCRKTKMCVLSGRPELLGWYKSLGYEETGENTPFPGPESGLTPAQEGAHFIGIGKDLKG